MTPRDPNMPNDPDNGGHAEQPAGQKPVSPPPTQPSGQGNGQPTDGRLLRSLRRGDVAAFAPLFARHGARLWRLSRLLTNDDASAEQVLVAGLRHALTELTFAREVQPLETWLYGQIVRQAWLAGSRRQPETTPQRPGPGGRPAGHPAARPAVPINPLTYGADDRLTPPAEDWGIRLDGEVLHDQLRIVLARSAPALPPDLRAAWALVDVEKISFAQAGEALDLAPATVRGRVHRARLLLRQALTRHVQGAAAVEATGPSS